MAERELIYVRESENGAIIYDSRIKRELPLLDTDALHPHIEDHIGIDSDGYEFIDWPGVLESIRKQQEGSE